MTSGQPAATRSSWSGESPLRRAARERLIEATGRCIVRDGLTATSLSSVAAEAGVSRPTVYRYFADRQTLIQATARHAGQALATDLARHLRPWHGDAQRLAVEAMLHVVGAVPQDPLLAAIWTSTVLDAALLADFTSPEVVKLARNALRELVKAARWSDAEADAAVEWMLRALLSLLVAPGPARSEADLRAYLERWLVPGLRLAGSTPDRR